MQDQRGGRHRQTNSFGGRISSPAMKTQGCLRCPRRVCCTDGVQMLWFRDWYDGPLDGLAHFEGRDYWFAATDDWVNDRPRRFVFIEAPDADLGRERAAHAANAVITSGSVADDEELFSDCPR